MAGLLSRLYRVISTARRILADDSPTSIFSKDLNTKANSHFGEYSYGLPTVFDWGEGKELRVGKFCSFASEVTVFLGGGHRTDWITTYPFTILNKDFPAAIGLEGHPVSKGDVIIGNDVWIGHGATILSGVRIGDGAVVGAKSLVAKDVAPYTIVAGNPARVIKKRFSDEDIDFLLKLRWWDWPVERINQNVSNLCSDSIEKLRHISE